MFPPSFKMSQLAIFKNSDITRPDLPSLLYSVALYPPLSSSNPHAYSSEAIFSLFIYISHPHCTVSSVKSDSFFEFWIFPNGTVVCSKCSKISEHMPASTLTRPSLSSRIKGRVFLRLFSTGGYGNLDLSFCSPSFSPSNPLGHNHFAHCSLMENQRK